MTALVIIGLCATLLVCTELRGHVSAFTPSTGTNFTALNKPGNTKEGGCNNSVSTLHTRRHGLLLAKQCSNDTSPGTQQQYIEDGILYTEFAPLYPNVSAPSQSDTALQEAVHQFYEVDCSGNADSKGDLRDMITIPYDEMQLAFFQGDEVVNVVLENTKDSINMSCEQLFQYHKSRNFAGLTKESERNAAAAMRSIRCLIYWVGGRILHCAKLAMDRADRHEEDSSVSSESVRRSIEGRIRRMVTDTVKYWEDIVKPKHFEPYLKRFPRIKETSSPEEYVAKVWDYLNTMAFDGELPEFVDMRFGWYDLLNPDGTVVNTSQEMFRFSQKYDIAFPRIAYPKEFIGRAGALGNCIFRSMLKLYCDIYGPKLMDEDYASTAIAACRFVESAAARQDGIGFSCLQSDLISSDKGLRKLLPQMNASKPLRNADVDINDTVDIFPEIHQLPYFRNRICLDDLIKAAKDTNTALQIFDRSFKPLGQELLDQVDTDLKRVNVEVSAAIAVDTTSGHLNSKPHDPLTGNMDPSTGYVPNNMENTNMGSTTAQIPSGKTSADKDTYYSEFVWSRDNDGNLTIPINELHRSLLFGDLDKFGNILSLGMNDLITLKPIQLNTIQNRIVTLCVDVLNLVRAFDAYALNFSLTPNDLLKQKTTGLIEKANMAIIQCILFLYKLVGRCLTHNGLYALDNGFLRTRPLELLIQENNPTEFQSKLAIDPSNFGSAAVKQEAKMQPVHFPQEYLNENVAADDITAIQFLINYYNFNLFGGRLPIDLTVTFSPEAGDEYLSSHDDFAEVLTVPTIRLNPLVAHSKPLVARLLLDECFNIFLRSCCSYKPEIVSKEQTLLTDVLESDLPRRLRHHIANCIETTGDWPFFFDELNDMALIEQPELTGHNFSIPLRGSTLNQIYKSLLNSDKDVIRTLEYLVKRTQMTELWERQVLPIRHFINALQSGDYDLSYTILMNPTSVAAISHMPISEINILENKFKEALDISHALDDERGQVLSDNRKQMNALANVEAFKIVECAFDELREQATKHMLISASDLTEGITHATNNLARCQPEEVAQQNVETDCTIIGTDNLGVHREIRRSSKDEDLVKKFMGTSTKVLGSQPTSTMPSEGAPASSSKSGSLINTGEDSCPDVNNPNQTSTERYTLNKEEREVFTEAVYRSYNHSLFHNTLPRDIHIVFTDSIKDLSELEVDIHCISPPTIKLNSLLCDAKLLFLQMMVQMVNLSFSSSTHNIEVDCLRYIGLPYRSAFQRFHAIQQQFIKNRLLPLSREARQKAAKAKDGVNASFVNSLKEAADIKPAGGSGNSILEMEIDEFVDEVLEGRQKIKAGNNEESLCNPFEEYQALKSFARHFVNWKRSKNNYQEAAKVNPQRGISVANKLFQMLNSGIFRTIWGKGKFQQIEKALNKMGMEMPLSLPLKMHWQQLLDEDQQYNLMKYLTLDAKDNESVYTLLVNSGACSRQQACDLLVKLADPLLKLEPFPNNLEDPMVPPPSELPTHIGENSDRHEPDTEDPLSSESFASELDSITKGMDLATAETVNLLVDKLVHRNYSDAMGILSNHPKRHYLKEMAIKYLDAIRNNGVIKERHHIEILEFLKN
ncbi:hypothetical protein BaOVIS_025660 [Babesia ovis]|uniref:Uncharacterized protein n=1 Tax=Babesia ovis TaxID=5869 RepID=A0A9W5TBM5_BABOV|nr:hypothetical protein BaOVIS_025660 [Babesia ovis]